MKFSFGLILIAILLVLLTSCAVKESGAVQKESVDVAKEPTDEETPELREEKYKDKGDFSVTYTAPKNSEYAELQQILQESKLFDTTADELNKLLVLPVNVPITLTECQDVNAFYDQEKKQIIVCYELMSHIATLSSEIVESEEELDKALIDTSFFIFFHELGHALSDVLQLPTTGREEDAADQLATVIFTEVGEEGEDAALSAAVFFLQAAQQTNVEELAFWDEHALDIQRFYNIACWVYGKNPQRHSYLIEEGILPEERAVKCEDEYNKISNSWNVLLSPYLKE